MKTIQDEKALSNFSGHKLKRAVVRSRFAKEQVVAHIQDKGIKFSLTGLDRIYRNELPRKETQEILAGIAEKLCCNLDDFTEVTQQELI